MTIIWVGYTTQKLEWLPLPQTFNNTEDDNNGFTKIIKSYDALEFFVSTSGDDAIGDGRQASPFRTGEKAEDSCREGFPDIIRFRCGDDFSGDTYVMTNAMKGGRSQNERRVITTYDNHLGDRPIVKAPAFAFEASSGDNISIIGFRFADGGSEEHLAFRSHTSNLLIEDCYSYHREWLVENNTNVTLKRNIIDTSYADGTTMDIPSRPSGLYLAKNDGVQILENFMDYGGWEPNIAGAGANLFDHDIYMQYDNDGFRVSAIGNTLLRPAAHSIQLRAGGISSDNFSGRGAVGMGMGYGPEVLQKDVKVYNLNNVNSEGWSMMRGADNAPDPVACDSEGNLCTPAVWGDIMSLTNDCDYKRHSNINSISSVIGTYDTLPFPLGWNRVFEGSHYETDWGYDETDVEESNNVVYHWDTAIQGDGDGHPDPERTLGTMYAKLVIDGIFTGSEVGDDDFDKFAGAVKFRQREFWETETSGRAICDYIRLGFNTPRYTL